MNFKYILLAIITLTLFSGCSSRSKGFFEDLYSATEVRSATSQDYADVKAPKNAPIIIDTEEKEKTTEKNSRNYSSNSTHIYHATGKIINVDYDKDVNLYVYSFLKSGTANPIIFYYDQNLKQYTGKIITITVKDNFLIEHSYSNSTTTTQKIKRTRIKRRRSRIKVPIVEKINTL